MVGPTIRRARPADYAAVQELWTALHREQEASDPRYRLAPDAAQRWMADLRAWSRSDADRVFVAEHDDGLIGLLVAHLHWPAPIYEQRLLVWVDDLYVRPAFRGCGVGRGLLHAAVRWGADAGAREVRAGVLASNGAARRFWEGMGAGDYAVTVSVPMAPEG